MTSSSEILIVAAFALLLAGAAGATTSGKVIANGTVLQGGLYAYAQANAVGPSSLSARIATTPSQKILLQWKITCSNVPTTNGAAGAAAYVPTTKQKSGQKSVTSPAIAVMPLPFAHAKSCSVSLYAQLVKKAKTTLQILQS